MTSSNPPSKLQCVVLLPPPTCKVVARDGRALQYASPSLRLDSRLVLLALKSCARALGFVPMPNGGPSAPPPLPSQAVVQAPGLRAPPPLPGHPQLPLGAPAIEANSGAAPGSSTAGAGAAAANSLGPRGDAAVVRLAVAGDPRALALAADALRSDANFVRSAPALRLPLSITRACNEP